MLNINLETEIQEKNTTNLNKMPLLEATAVCCVLEDVIDQIMILGNIDMELLTTQVQINIASLKERTKLYIKSDPIYNIINGELFSETVMKMKFLKMQIDRLFLEKILVQIKNELKDEGTFTTLTTYIQNYKKNDNEEASLISDEDNNKTYASTLKIEINRKIEESAIELQRVNMLIAKYKDDIETKLFENALELRYVESWENARIEQGFMICDQNENELMETINKYKNEIEKEIRVNSEIEMYIAENQKDIEDGIENWIKRYDTELEERQTQITMLKDQREEQDKRIEAMKAIYIQHGEEIQDFLDYKEQKRIQEELEIAQEAAAIKIQAWWRGLMVRLQLGQFNPRKGRRGGAKKKGKKKK